MAFNYLAIVPARAGSKRVADKNIADLGGRPLIAWSIGAGLACPHISRVWVSTDSLLYQDIAVREGADCPTLRSEALASDTASSADVVLDVLSTLGPEVEAYDGLALLQPTSPLRTAGDLTAAIELHQQQRVPAVVSVCAAECPPAWIGKLGPNGQMDDFMRPEYRGLRSQDMGDFYRLNGAIYLIGIQAFRAERGFLPVGTLAYVMPRSRSIDIDTNLDLAIARQLAGSDVVE